MEIADRVLAEAKRTGVLVALDGSEDHLVKIYVNQYQVPFAPCRLAAQKKVKEGALPPPYAPSDQKKRFDELKDRIYQRWLERQRAKAEEKAKRAEGKSRGKEKGKGKQKGQGKGKGVKGTRGEDDEEEEESETEDDEEKKERKEVEGEEESTRSVFPSPLGRFAAFDLPDASTPFQLGLVTGSGVEDDEPFIECEFFGPDLKKGNSLLTCQWVKGVVDNDGRWKQMKTLRDDQRAKVPFEFVFLDDFELNGKGKLKKSEREAIQQYLDSGA